MTQHMVKNAPKPAIAALAGVPSTRLRQAITGLLLFLFIYDSVMGDLSTLAKTVKLVLACLGRHCHPFADLCTRKSRPNRLESDARACACAF